MTGMWLYLLFGRRFWPFLIGRIEYETDIQNSAQQLDRCISILVPKTEDLFSNEDFGIRSENRSPTTVTEPSYSEQLNSTDDQDSEEDTDDDFVEVPSKKTKEELEEERFVELRYLGILNQNGPMSIDEFKNTNLTIDLNLREDDENKVVIEIMRDLYKELKNSSLARINNWIKVGVFKICLCDSGYSSMACLELHSNKNRNKRSKKSDWIKESSPGSTQTVRWFEYCRSSGYRKGQD